MRDFHLIPYREEEASTMFFLKEETKVITLHPSYFGPNMREYLINRLNEEEEGRCTGDHFVICVMDMVDMGEGRVLPSGGHAEYSIKYRAIIWKPFRGETVRAGFSPMLFCCQG